MRQLLLCPPDYYGIEYEINPWMSRQRQADQKLAMEQWQGLVSILTRLGVEISLLTPAAGLPDLVFTANAALIYKRRAILSHFRHEQRQGEEPLCAAWFKQHGFTVEILPEGRFFEGAGDALFCGPAYLPYRGLSPLHQAWNPGLAPATPGTTGFIGGTTGFAGVSSSSPVGVGYEHCALQIRETETFICYQVPFRSLNLGDVEVEVLGNRIICRTKTALHPSDRFWNWSAMPQGVQVFEPTFFARFNPVTADEMVRQLPGFTLDEGEDLRGFGATAGNVLIDGRRPSNKTGLKDELSRIAARDVLRIELIRASAAGDLDVRGYT